MIDSNEAAYLKSSNFDSKFNNLKANWKRLPHYHFIHCSKIRNSFLFGNY